MRIVNQIQKENYKDIDSLRKEFGTFKKYPLPFEIPILIALSYFPELKHQKIAFIQKKSTFAFASRPIISSLFKSKKNRSYEIILSTYSSKVPMELLFPSLPFNAQIGILGHELSHSVFYLDKNLFQFISMGFGYLFPKYRVKFEKETDKETIRRGLGFQLLEYANYSRQHPSVSSKLKNWLDYYYLQPKEIEKYMDQFPEYNR